VSARVIALAAAIVLFAAPAAWADDAARFDAAMAALATSPNEAVAALEAIAHDAPTSPLAPEALLLAARAAEEQLGDPARALATYDAIVARYPDARAAVAAGRRGADLRAMIGPGVEGATEARAWAALRTGAGLTLTTAQHAEAERLAAAAWPGAIDAALWLADLDERAGAVAAARTRLAALAIRVAGTPRAVDVVRATAALAVRTRDVTTATRLLAELPADSARDAALRSELAAEIDRLATQARVVLAARIVALLALLVLLGSLVTAAGSLGAAVRSLRPPLDVWYVAPVLGVVALAAATGFTGIGRAVAFIASAGVAVTWLSAAALDVAATRGRRSRWRPLVHAVVAPALVLAIATSVLLAGDLADLVLATLREGPDR